MKLSKKDTLFLENHLDQKKSISVYGKHELTKKLHNESINKARAKAQEFMKNETLEKRIKP